MTAKSIRLRAATRQITGTPYVYHAYVIDRHAGRPIRACRHRHRLQSTAQRCADSMLKQELKQDGPS